jgi:hypothetical protein
LAQALRARDAALTGALSAALHWKSSTLKEAVAA